MLGPPKTRDLDRPVLIAVESYVPKDHLFRHPHRVLGLSLVRDLVADRYTSSGRPSIDPEVFFRLHLIMFLSGIRFERQLLEVARAAAVPTPGADEGEHGGTVHRGRAELEAIIERKGLGTAPMAGWECRVRRLVAEN